MLRSFKETSFKHAAHGDIAGVPLANRFLASVIENVGIGGMRALVMPLWRKFFPRSY